MADSLQIPNDLTDIVEIKVIKKDKQLRDFLTDLLIKVNQLEKRIIELENGN